MPPKTKITLTDAQKYEFCLYAHHNPGTRIEYVNWIENKWNVRVSESTVSRILQKRRSDFRLRLIHQKQRNKSVTFRKLEQALKEFVRVCQYSREIY